MSQMDIADRLSRAHLPARDKADSSPRGRLANLSLGWIVPALVLMFWTVATSRGWAPPQLLPAPKAVGETLLDQLRSGELLTHFAISSLRIAGGFGLGSTIGIAIGIAMGLSRSVEAYLHPTFKAVSQVPVLGWLPLAMMVFGIGESLKVVLISHAVLVPVAINTMKGVRGVPHQYVDVARALRFSHPQLLRRVVLPYAIPSIFAGVRYGITAGWLSLVTVELLASSEGLGFLIVWGRQLFQLDLVLAAIIVVGIVGLSLDKLLTRIEGSLLSWRPRGV